MLGRWSLNGRVKCCRPSWGRPGLRVAAGVLRAAAKEADGYLMGLGKVHLGQASQLSTAL